MRVKEIKDIDGFFKTLEKCEGRVELITDENYVLNLASNVTHFICLTRVFKNPHIKEYEIVCYNIEDYELIKDYLVPVEK